MSDESQKYVKEFIANRLNELLTANKIKNQKALGHLTGHGEKLVYDLLNKKHNSTVVSIYDLCDFFGITLADFFRIDFSKDKSSDALVKLAEEKLEGEDRNLLYRLIDDLDRDALRTILKSYDTFREAENKKEEEKR